MTNKLQIRRALLLLTCFVALFAGLGYRLVDLQVIRHDDLLKLAEKKTERRISETAKRGDILDVNGNLLATSVPVRTVWANPELLATGSTAAAERPGGFRPNAGAFVEGGCGQVVSADVAAHPREREG